MIVQQAARSRYGRFAAVGAAVLLCFVFLFSTYQKRDDLARWSDKTINAIKGKREHPPWLLATISPVSGLQRRTIIRDTWQRLYANSSRFETRFVIANVTELWRPLIEAENATYGDLITLPHIEEERTTARSIKPMEYFKYLVDQQQPRYKFVSKIDDDTFLEANGFWDKYLQPLLDAPSQPPSHTVIGKSFGPMGDYHFTWPGGQFYTLSWDLLAQIVAQYKAHGPGIVRDEDALVGAMLKDSGAEFDFTMLPPEEAYNFGGEAKDGPRNGGAWAGKEANLHANQHGVSVGTLNVHELKRDEDYLLVAGCFDENGLKTLEWANGLIDY